MDIKYGSLPSSTCDDYYKSLVNRIWVLIPLKEEQCPTLTQKIERLNRELCGMIRTFPTYGAYLLTIINLLENLISEEDFKIYRADVLRCCELIKKITGGDSHV